MAAAHSYRFRVVDNVIFETGNNFSISPVLLCQATDYKQYGGMQHWFSAGVRPQAHFNEYVSLAFEPFIDWTAETCLHARIGAVQDRFSAARGRVVSA
jgi:maltoporin